MRQIDVCLAFCGSIIWVELPAPGSLPSLCTVSERPFIFVVHVSIRVNCPWWFVMPCSIWPVCCRE